MPSASRQMICTPLLLLSEWVEPAGASASMSPASSSAAGASRSGSRRPKRPASQEAAMMTIVTTKPAIPPNITSASVPIATIQPSPS
jgi:hypothetical protein